MLPASPNLYLQVQWGIMGGVTSIPPAFSISFALACASSINAAVHAYGRLLTSSNPPASTLRSPELQLLGYATDNGAYYYYKVLNLLVTEFVLFLYELPHLPILPPPPPLILRPP